MPTIVQFSQPHQVELVECDREAMRPGHVRVRTWYSGISAGTELTAYRGTNPYLTKTWDAERRIYVDGAPTFEYPTRGWGYSEVGEVVEVAEDVSAVEPGDVVAGIWGHRSEGLFPAEAAHWTVLPRGSQPVHGVFSRVGAVALNAVLAADGQLGEDVAVFGQGVIGLLATQLVGLGGSRAIAVDTLADRLRLAGDLGAAHAVPADVGGGAGVAIRGLTHGRGADAAIELSGSAAALHEAIRSVAVEGTVVAAGFYQGEATGLRLGEEFHHNRVNLVASQIGGPPPRLAGRWDQRRMVTTFLGLVAAGSVDVDRLVSHEVNAADVDEAFRLLDETPEKALQVILRFPAA